MGSSGGGLASPLAQGVILETWDQVPKNVYNFKCQRKSFLLDFVKVISIYIF